MQALKGLCHRPWAFFQLYTVHWLWNTFNSKWKWIGMHLTFIYGFHISNYWSRVKFGIDMENSNLCEPYNGCMLLDSHLWRNVSYDSSLSASKCEYLLTPAHGPVTFQFHTSLILLQHMAGFLSTLSAISINTYPGFKGQLTSSGFKIN